MARDPAVGARIRQIRRGLNLTQQEFGRKLGLTKVSVARYEAGRVPRLDLLRRISQLGDVPIGWLLQAQVGSSTAGRHEVSLSKGVRTRRARDILRRLASRLEGNHQWPPQYWKRYEQRIAEVLLRALRELEEYKALLDSKYQIAAAKGKGRQAEK